ncbi:MAG TPA: hypothetical protein VGT99_14135 [Gammaproteobacteria bacterium]|nr:hypothetical protein [Gammaproteobacteria bacterium]
MAKPRTGKSAAPGQREAEQQPLPIDLAVPGRQDATAKRRSIAAAPVVAPSEDRRRRGIVPLILILLLMLGSFWIGRISTQAPGAAPTPPPMMTTSASALAPTVAPKAAAVPPGGGTAASNGRPDRVTTLLEVSVGTTSRGGLTLRFDHPVDWSVNGATGDAEAELDVRGVHALGTFPRNLPLPPGVSAIHAGIAAPDALKLKFGLQPGVRLITVPAAGPAAALNIYFRTPVEEALASTSAAAVDAGACGAQASPEAAKAITLLQRSLDKNPGYEAVRQTLALLETCAGDGAKAEQLLAEGVKSGGGVKLAVTDAALRYARGDIDGALKSLRDGAPAGATDPAYQELMADLQAATQP